MSKTLRLVATIVVFFSAPVLWYCIAANYDYGALAGTYTFRSGNETCTLHLYSDQIFLQDITTQGHTQTAKGTWRRFGESGMDLSDSFLRIPGQQLGPSGENYGHFDKVLGVFPVLTLDPDRGGPRFHRSLISFITKR